jgi:hypothetical protein
MNYVPDLIKETLETPEMYNSYPGAEFLRAMIAQ